MKLLIAFALCFSTVLLAEHVESGKIYTIKKVKYFAAKDDDKNSLAHLIVFLAGKNGYRGDLFCSFPPGVDPNKGTKVKVNDRASAAPGGKDYLCDLIK